MNKSHPRSTLVYLALMGRDTTVCRKYYISEQLKHNDHGKKNHNHRKRKKTGKSI